MITQDPFHQPVITSRELPGGAHRRQPASGNRVTGGGAGELLIGRNHTATRTRLKEIADSGDAIHAGESDGGVSSRQVLERQLPFITQASLKRQVRTEAPGVLNIQAVVADAVAIDRGNQRILAARVLASALRDGR